MTAAEFDRLFLVERQKLVHYAHRLCRNYDQAEDLVQTAALRAWSWLQRNVLSGPFCPWMHVIVKRCFLCWREREQTHDLSLDVLLEESEGNEAVRPEFADPAPTPEEALVAEVVAPELLAAINALPTELFRETVRAVYLRGEEPDSKANQRLWKARKMMRQFLGVIDVGRHSLRYCKRGLLRA